MFRLVLLTDVYQILCVLLNDPVYQKEHGCVFLSLNNQALIGVKRIPTRQYGSKNKVNVINCFKKAFVLVSNHIIITKRNGLDILVKTAEGTLDII